MEEGIWEMLAGSPRTAYSEDLESDSEELRSMNLQGLQGRPPETRKGRGNYAGDLWGP